jgi:UDP-2-acetamido-2-deoxy-ribo-hexuluronate aminotransferase
MRALTILPPWGVLSPLPQLAEPPLRWCDLIREYEDIGNEVREAMDKVCKNGAFILGPDVADLEGRLATYTGAKNCISVGSGTVAIEVLLRAMGIGPGDEVITVPFTWISTAECISLVGATPGESGQKGVPSPGAHLLSRAPCR